MSEWGQPNQDEGEPTPPPPQAQPGQQPPTAQTPNNFGSAFPPAPPPPVPGPPTSTGQPMPRPLPSQPRQTVFRGMVATTLGKVIVGLAFLGFVAIVIFSLLTTTQIEGVQVGDCFDSWDDFDGGQSGEFIPDSVGNAECDGLHAVEAFHVFEPGETTDCESAFRDQLVPNENVAWFAVDILRGFGSAAEVTKTICFVGHVDESTLITGSLLKGT